MVDIVVNHFAYPGPANLINYSRFHPFNDASFFHSFCEITNYEDQDMVERCWLGDANVELVDVKTEDSRVRSTYQSWISSLVSNYSSKSLQNCLLILPYAGLTEPSDVLVDGLRIDTTKHVQKSFWPSFGKAAGVFCTGEVLSNSSDYTCDYQNYLDSVLNYPMYVECFYFSQQGTNC
jgi:alpha-amylase